MGNLIFCVQQLINSGINLSDMDDRWATNSRMCNLLFCVQQLIFLGSNMYDVDNRWANAESAESKGKSNF